MTILPLDAVERAFADLLTHSNSRIGGADHVGLPNRPHSMPEIVEVLRDPCTVQETCDSLWRFFLEQFDNDEWATLSLGLALPAMRKSVAKAARIWDRDLIDLQAEAINAFIALARQIDTTSDRLYSHLCNRVKGACRTFARGLARNAKSIHQVGFDSCLPPEPWSHIDLVLTRAINEGVITREEADLIVMTRLEQVKLGRVAQSNGVSRIEISLLRKRAEHRLTEWLIAEQKL